MCHPGLENSQMRSEKLSVGAHARGYHRPTTRMRSDESLLRRIIGANASSNHMSLSHQAAKGGGTYAYESAPVVRRKRKASKKR